MKRKKEDREWTVKEHVATENIARLKEKIETIAATIKEYDQLERERLKKEKRSPGWLGFRLFIGSCLKVRRIGRGEGQETARGTSLGSQ